MDKVAVLIPCYNEEQTVSKVIGDVKEALPEARIYVYDNNSTDDTAKIELNPLRWTLLRISRTLSPFARATSLTFTSWRN